MHAYDVDKGGPGAMKPSAERPSGITYIVSFAILGGILETFGGLALLFLGSFMYVVGSGPSQNRVLTTVFQVVGILTLVIGILSVVFGILAAFRRKPWVWTLGVTLYISMILLSIIAIVLGNDLTKAFFVSIVISAIILFEMLTRDGRRAFGKA
jgi:uncharacterized membrane protein YfcA